MATDQEARDAGFILPADNDWIRDGDDAITNNAKKTVDLVNGARWARGRLTTTSNLVNIGFGAWEVVSGTVSEALGLPTGLSGALVKMPTDGVNAVIRWYPRSNKPREYHANVSSNGLGRWEEVSAPRITPATFGAVGDGVKDDSAALEQFFAAAAAEPGNYYLDMATYRVTRQIWVPSTRSGFNVEGVNSELSRIFMDSNMITTILAGRDIRNMHLSKFRLTGKDGAPASHGFSFSDCVACTVLEVDVYAYQNSAGLFFRYTDTAVSEGNKIIRCTAQGGGIANNGFLHETSRNWLIENCNVYNLNMEGSPGYGLQAKNSCSNGIIQGGLVINAPAAVAFGSDDPDSSNTRCDVSGVIAVGCRYGFIASGTTYSNVDILVDGAGMPDGGHPVRIGARCSGLNVKLAMHRVPTGRTVVYVGSSGNTVEVEPLSAKPGYLAEFVVGLQNTTFIYKGDPSHAVINDKSERDTNAVVLLQDGGRVTGLREVSSLIKEPWVMGGGGFIRLLRRGSVVTVIVSGVQNTAPEPGYSDIAILPTGFKPNAALYSRSFRDVVCAISSSGQLRIQNPVSTLDYFHFTFLTQDEWPTTMPGIPA